MDPPSFTKQICREKLNNISEENLNSMQEMIVEKAQKINQKLNKGNEEEGEDDDEGEGPSLPPATDDAEEEKVSPQKESEQKTTEAIV